jgi:hypothetical protein
VARANQLAMDNYFNNAREGRRNDLRAAFGVKG